MANSGSHCKAQARGRVLLAMLFIAYAAGAASTVGAQTPASPASSSAAMASDTDANSAEVPVQLIAPTRPFGFTREESVDLSETYETTPLGLQQTRSDLLTVLSLGIGLHDHTVRFTGDLQYTLLGDLYARHSKYDQLDNYLQGLVTTSLIPEHLIVGGRAFASPVVLNALGPLAASGLPVAGGTNSGMSNAYGYSISPELAFRLGNFANSDSSLTQSGLFLLSPQGPLIPELVPGAPPPSRLMTYTARELISGGSEFNRLNWQLTGTGLRLTEPAVEFQQLSGNADIAYAISRGFALLATGGYQSFTSNQTFIRNITGPVELGGFRISSGPILQASFRAGEQFNLPSYIANFHYEIAPATTFDFSLTDSVAPPAEALLGNLNLLGVNNQGAFFNTGYQLSPVTPPLNISPVSAFNPAPISGPAITNVISRYRFATASLVHLEERTQYRLTGFWSDYNAVVITPGIAQQTLTGGEIAIFRNLNPYVTAELSFDYRIEKLLGGGFSEADGNVSLNYQLTAMMKFYLRMLYGDRLSDTALRAASPSTTNLSDAAITVGIRRQF